MVNDRVSLPACGNARSMTADKKRAPMSLKAAVGP
jgi:hypothetical protein